jgi:hypothetical protein
MDKTCDTQRRQEDAYVVLVGESEGIRPLWTLRRKRTKQYEIGCERSGIALCEFKPCDVEYGQATVLCKHSNETSGFVKYREFSE